MLKKYNEEEFQKLLEQEFTDEADRMEEALFSEEDFVDLDVSDEELQASYERLVEKLKKAGVYREDTPVPQKRKKWFFRTKLPFRLAKVAGIVLVCALGVFAASMTSEANRTYFIESIRYWAGDDTRLVIGNDAGNEDPDADEHIALERIEEELGVEMPEFYYRPTHFEYYSYEANPYAGIGRIEYEYEESIVTLSVRKKEDFQSSRSIDNYGAVIEKIPVEADGEVTVTLQEARDEQDTASTYTAQWQIGSAVYQLRGRMNKEELKKIIQYMKY